MSKYNLLFSVVIISFFLSCGKTGDAPGLETKGPRDARGDERNLNDFLVKQKTVCADELQCPENIAKIIVTDEKRSFTRYCTGFLIDSDKMMTSSSCLKPAQRVPRIDCSKSIYVVFPKSVLKLNSFYGCSKIIHADNNRSVNNPSFWKNDVTVFELDAETDRRPLPFSSKGLVDDEVVTSWKVETVDSYTGELKKETCNSHINTWLNPFSTNKSSPMGVISNCNLAHGSIGAPIIHNGEVTGVFSQEMSERLRNYLRRSPDTTGDLTRYYHISNLACTQFQNGFQTRNLPRECIVETSFARLDRKRRGFLASTNIHRSNMNELLLNMKRSILEQNDQISWEPEFIKKESYNEYEVTLGKAVCLNNPNSWVQNYSYVNWRRRRIFYEKSWINFEVPFYRLAAKLNSSLQAESIIDDKETKEIKVAFSPRMTRFNKKTYVEVQSTLFGERDIYRMNDISACSP